MMRIIVTGLIAQHPVLGGLAWHYIQYAAGLARLGHEVHYFEHSGEWPYNLDGGPTGQEWTAQDCTANLRYLERVMAQFGLTGRWAYHFPKEDQWFGLSDLERRAAVESADVLINVSGTLQYPEQYATIPLKIYIDTDPVFTQINCLQGDADRPRRIEVHDATFSFGESFSSATPTTSHRWRPTRQPVLLSEWHPARPARDVYTTVMNWTSYQPLAYCGTVYGQKDAEFRKFFELPTRAGAVRFEVALLNTQHHEWQDRLDDLSPAIRAFVQAHPGCSPLDILRRCRWDVADAAEMCGDLDRYRDYIETSRGEWSVAKSGYVRGDAGWFSDRSACYLAAGRPVVLQETGFTRVLPTGEGLLTFTTLEEAAAAVTEVESDYPRHARAARALAEEYFGSDRVLTQLLEKARCT